MRKSEVLILSMLAANGIFLTLISYTAFLPAVVPGLNIPRKDAIEDFDNEGNTVFNSTGGAKFDFFWRFLIFGG